jgi:hypothetical protein
MNSFIFYIQMELFGITKKFAVQTAFISTDHITTYDLNRLDIFYNK